LTKLRKQVRTEQNGHLTNRPTPAWCRILR